MKMKKWKLILKTPLIFLAFGLCSTILVWKYWKQNNGEMPSTISFSKFEWKGTYE